MLEWLLDENLFNSYGFVPRDMPWFLFWRCFGWMVAVSSLMTIIIRCFKGLTNDVADVVGVTLACCIWCVIPALLAALYWHGALREQFAPPPVDYYMQTLTLDGKDYDEKGKPLPQVDFRWQEPVGGAVKYRLAIPSEKYIKSNLMAQYPQMATEDMRKKYRECEALMKEYNIFADEGEPFVVSMMLTCGALEGWIEKEERKLRALENSQKTLKAAYESDAEAVQYLTDTK